MNEFDAEPKTIDLDEARRMVEKADAIARAEHWRRHDERVALAALKRVLGAALPGMIEQAISEVAASRAREAQPLATRTA